MLCCLAGSHRPTRAVDNLALAGLLSHSMTLCYTRELEFRFCTEADL